MRQVGDDSEDSGSELVLAFAVVVVVVLVVIVADDMGRRVIALPAEPAAVVEPGARI